MVCWDGWDRENPLLRGGCVWCAVGHPPASLIAMSCLSWSIIMKRYCHHPTTHAVGDAILYQALTRP